MEAVWCNDAHRYFLEEIEHRVVRRSLFEPRYCFVCLLGAFDPFSWLEYTLGYLTELRKELLKRYGVNLCTRGFINTCRGKLICINPEALVRTKVLLWRFEHDFFSPAAGIILVSQGPATVEEKKYLP